MHSALVTGFGADAFIAPRTGWSIANIIIDARSPALFVRTATEGSGIPRTNHESDLSRDQRKRWMHSALVTGFGADAFIAPRSGWSIANIIIDARSTALFV